MDHAVRGRLNAWVLDAVEGAMHRTYGALKTQLFSGHPDTLVELGPGAGANLRYYRPGTRVIAIEPNVRMHPRLRARAEQLGLRLELHAAGAESLDFADASVAMVTCSLVLCSVGSPERVVAEVRRVLAPGGRFACLEHVIAPPGTPTRAVQHAIRRPWRWLFEGCDLCNRTEAVVRAAGFARVDIEHLRLSAQLGPVRYHIAGTARA